jgi:hypothetical protein
MNKQNIILWGREFSLEIIYDCYPGEDVIDNQKEALMRILAMPTVIDGSQKNIEGYLLTNKYDDVGGTIDNIFKYVMPRSLFVPRSNEHRSIAIMCDYKFDPEHGLAVVFEDEKFKAVGTQDIIL